ncbi:hypothetical protein HAHE_07660 [Haloferula helveola]|uniref:Type IV pilus biogenesis n=1 Tax=Haloferula helveola TaxID=490095 RepID=A0ABN6H1I6_9BACT|nr:hypothetical protein HAHE_07660 [Haloferula helveola]
MTSREKVLLGIVAVAAIGAGVYFVSGAASPVADSPPPARPDLTALIASVQVNLKKGQLTDREERILAAAATPWARNPLRDRPLAARKREVESTQLPQYTGFINIGSQPIAIIDGRDYRAGEMIEGGEFQLSEIHSDHVKLIRRGATDPVDVPLEQEQIPGSRDQTAGAS